MGYSPHNLSKSDLDKKHILVELEQPNRFLHPESHSTTFICENFYDKILTINPEFVASRNKALGRDLYEHVFFPYSSRYVLNTTQKTNDIIYTGNRNYFGICDKFYHRRFVWVGANGNISNISYEEKINLTRSSKIALSHSIVDFSPWIDFLDRQKETIKHVNGIFEQHKARTIEAAINKAIIIHVNTGQRLIEEFFSEGEDFLYYRDGLIEDILNDYEKFAFLSENAYNKAINNYTTEHFYKKYIQPLL
jgi:hypothetical protein